MTKLWEYFVYLDPSPTLIADLAQSFRASSYDLNALMAMMFKSEAFYSARAKTGIMKSPTDYGVGFIRSTGLQIELEHEKIRFGDYTLAVSIRDLTSGETVSKQRHFRVGP